MVAALLLLVGTASHAHAQSWGVTEARQMCAPAPQGASNYGQSIGEAALRIAIHPHTPATVRVQPIANPDNDDIVFTFTTTWTTSVANSTCTTVFVARVRREGLQSVAVQQDNSGKVGQGNSEKLNAFFRDALWGTINGWLRVPRDVTQAMVNSAGAILNTGFGARPYSTFVFPGKDDQGNTMIVFALFWEKGMLKTNQNTILTWRYGQSGHVRLNTETTSPATNAAGLESYFRDTLGPAVRGR